MDRPIDVNREDLATLGESDGMLQERQSILAGGRLPGDGRISGVGA